MGQALRRAAGKVRPASLDPPPPPAQHAKTVERRPSVAQAGTADVRVSGADRLRGDPGPDVPSILRNESNILEERDPSYDDMLNKMIGRISSKPGGKLETGNAFIVEKYNRPLPKLRTSKAEVYKDERKAVPPGTLDTVQLKQVILLHQGKSEDNEGPMGVDEIAKKFRIDAIQVQKILQFVSLPSEDSKKVNNMPPN